MENWVGGLWVGVRASWWMRWASFLQHNSDICNDHDLPLFFFFSHPLHCKTTTMDNSLSVTNKPAFPLFFFFSHPLHYKKTAMYNSLSVTDKPCLAIESLP